MIHDPEGVVQSLEKRFLPKLEAYAKELKKEFPDVQIDLWSWSVGSLTPYQGHNLGIDCLFKNVPREQADNVALIIGVKHLSSAPMIDSADVCWGHPSGTVEAEILEAEVRYSAKEAEKIEQRLPELVSALRDALRRGKPSDWG